MSTDYRIISQQSHQRPRKQASEVLNVRCDFRDVLHPNELMTGTPTITEVTTSDLTLTNKAISNTELMILGEIVGIGEAVTFTLAGGSASTDYTLEVQIGTDATNAQTLRALLEIRVNPDT